MRRAAIVHFALPEEVREAVYVGDVIAVKRHAEEVGGGLARAIGYLIAGRPALAAFNHKMQRRRHMVGFGRPAHGARAGHGRALLHKADGLARFGGREQVESAKLIVVSPASPVAEGVEV